MASGEGKSALLRRIQSGLQTLYRLDGGLDVAEFLIDDTARNELFSGRSPREQLLVAGALDNLEVALYIAGNALENLEQHDPGRHLGDHNFSDFLLALEGVSHFVYLVHHAGNGRPVRALELELQAEVDKFVTCRLLAEESGEHEPDLLGRLFEKFHYAEDLDRDERARYAEANQQARSYAMTLEERFLNRRALPEMFAELRRFYRLDYDRKVEHIAKAA